MNDFLLFYNSISHNFSWTLDIYHSSIVGWIITIGYKPAHEMHGQNVIHVQDDCDMQLCFAKAQIALKEWLCENNGGY
ncbi:hypothetical protein TCA2_4415 [Paenibacillus sp. TCA20]|uniref:Uncharacterized protein n=1 Tax=Paenibacillus urinalis TaxID=521520 RepID=A0ABY7XK57_9BACL|nr:MULTISPECIES: hypothetical protein [Paenibacillus]WDI05245.1 hypothetical protein PUW25_25895 [Paenibacillus urinalis]GAK41923.1 hypothetical protein TCA2_4415 [Paenibacillus sp. TCA20]